MEPLKEFWCRNFYALQKGNQANETLLTVFRQGNCQVLQGWGGVVNFRGIG